MSLLKSRVFALGLVIAAGPAMAAEPQAPADGAFKGRTVTIYVGGTAGGGIDVGARMLARYMGKYLPGHPTVVVQNMPGAGGVRLLEHLNAVAPKDGTVLGAFAVGPLLDPILSPRKVNYKMTDFAAIGAIEKDVSFCTTWHASPVKTFEDAKKRETTVAGTGAGSSTDIYPVVLNAVLGSKFRVITGYLGTQETIMAVERGETDGRCGWGWASLKSSKPDWLRDKKLNFIIQLGLAKHKEAMEVPLAIDLAEKEEDKQVLRVLFAPLMMTRPYFAPPGTNPERVAELRRAFMAGLSDPGAVEELIKTVGERPDSTPGDEMQKLLADIYNSPEQVLLRLRNIVLDASKKN
jgi:tripartite-type tricarboxylate transporter receptor subunit TctC